MKLIDVRTTLYGKVADAQLDNALLSFSMPYHEYCELETSGRLNDEEAAIDSNIRFMSQIKQARFMPEQIDPRVEDDMTDYLDLKATEANARF